jgi:hypothetical protein
MRFARLVLALVAAAVYFCLGLAIGGFMSIPLALAALPVMPTNCGLACDWILRGIQAVTMYGTALLVAFGAFKAIR